MAAELPDGELLPAGQDAGEQADCRAEPGVSTGPWHTPTHGTVVDDRQPEAVHPCMALVSPASQNTHQLPRIRIRIPGSTAHGSMRQAIRRRRGKVVGVGRVY